MRGSRGRALAFLDCAPRPRAHYGHMLRERIEMLAKALALLAALVAMLWWMGVLA